jgi:predicted short-subunit dehydrogenase-like oxidoreductase (DUF2520 family)
MKAPILSIAIVGPGRLGQALGKLLNEEGFPVAFVAARRRMASRRAVRFIGGGVAVGMNAAELSEAAVLLITTSDAALAPVAERVAVLRDDWRGRVVLHTSGSVPALVLLPFKRRGAAIGSLHPFQTIPNPAAGVRTLRDCVWGIEGDPAARRVARRWVKALGGVTFLIRSGKKTLYHAAAFMVCPALVTLMNHSVRLLRRSGVPEKIARRMLGRIVTETAGNFAELGGRRALTGPAVRGDWNVIRGHLAALGRQSPEFIPLYKELVLRMATLAGRPIPAEVFGPLSTER